MAEGWPGEEMNYKVDDHECLRDPEVYYISDMCAQTYRWVRTCTLFWHGLEAWPEGVRAGKDPRRPLFS